MTNQSYGTCPLCGGDKEPGTTTFAADLGSGVVVVRQVPALVCVNCGDAWIENSAALKLNDIVADARRKQAVVEVTQWREVA